MIAEPAVLPAISTDRLARSYGSKPFREPTHALHPTSLAVPPGSIFALLGHNGAGKTTLLKLLVNILRPSGGSAQVLGRASTSVADDDFLRIGYVSENQELPAWMTVATFLQYQSHFYPTWNAAPFIERFELPMNRKLKHLSRGQLMKVALASVLAFSPSLIILDEPFSGLDPLVRDELIEALLDTAATQSTTIVLSSHDLAEIESFATHVAFLHAGNLLFSEEMPQLSARFRDVTVTFAPSETPGAPFMPTASSSEWVGVPTSWIRLRHTAHTLRFVHTQADVESIEQQVREAFPTATAIDIEPMNLRSIFLAIAKSGRAVEGGRS